MSLWDNLSMREKAAMMRAATKNGIFDINLIKQLYNKFDTGGPKKQYATYGDIVDNMGLYRFLLDTFEGKPIYRQSGNPEEAQWLYESDYKNNPNKTIGIQRINPLPTYDINQNTDSLNYNSTNIEGEQLILPGVTVLGKAPKNLDELIYERNQREFDTEVAAERAILNDPNRDRSVLPLEATMRYILQLVNKDTGRSALDRLLTGVAYDPNFQKNLRKLDDLYNAFGLGLIAPWAAPVLAAGAAATMAPLVGTFLGDALGMTAGGMLLGKTIEGLEHLVSDETVGDQLVDALIARGVHPAVAELARVEYMANPTGRFTKPILNLLGMSIDDPLAAYTRVGINNSIERSAIHGRTYDPFDNLNHFYKQNVSPLVDEGVDNLLRILAKGKEIDNYTHYNSSRPRASHEPNLSNADNALNTTANEPNIATFNSLDEYLQNRNLILQDLNNQSSLAVTHQSTPHIQTNGAPINNVLTNTADDFVSMFKDGLFANNTGIRTYRNTVNDDGSLSITYPFDDSPRLIVFPDGTVQSISWSGRKGSRVPMHSVQGDYNFGLYLQKIKDKLILNEKFLEYARNSPLYLYLKDPEKDFLEELIDRNLNTDSKQLLSFDNSLYKFSPDGSVVQMPDGTVISTKYLNDATNRNISNVDIYTKNYVLPTRDASGNAVYNGPVFTKDNYPGQNRTTLMDARGYDVAHMAHFGHSPLEYMKVMADLWANTPHGAAIGFRNGADLSTSSSSPMFYQLLLRNYNLGLLGKIFVPTTTTGRNNMFLNGLGRKYYRNAKGKVKAAMDDNYLLLEGESFLNNQEWVDWFNDTKVKPLREATGVEIPFATTTKPTNWSPNDIFISPIAGVKLAEGGYINNDYLNKFQGGGFTFPIIQESDIPAGLNSPDQEVVDSVILEQARRADANAKADEMKKWIREGTKYAPIFGLGVQFDDFLDDPGIGTGLDFGVSVAADFFPGLKIGARPLLKLGSTTGGITLRQLGLLNDLKGTGEKIVNGDLSFSPFFTSFNGESPYVPTQNVNILKTDKSIHGEDPDKIKVEAMVNERIKKLFDSNFSKSYGNGNAIKIKDYDPGFLKFFTLPYGQIIKFNDNRNKNKNKGKNKGKSKNNKKR